MAIWMLPWGLALLAYNLFLAWYVNWRGPLSKAEVQSALADLIATGLALDGRNDLATLKAFLEADDGREFFMLNLVRIAPGEIPDPVSGQPKPAREVMGGYTRMFLPALFARAGHPAIVARKIGGYFDAWGVEADPGWSILGYMRYRSRRDLAALVVDPRFAGAHAFKFAAMPQTYSFPAQPQIMTLAGPKVWVALALALAAALSHLAILHAQLASPPILAG
ncbi:hypothetical protein [Phenylobacterium sp.]|uniref:hypothetical protein n=1 Tax=Phenylobacterium sp. TaxID=1871053 RepID=UPI00272FBF9A|nr:hypothetical protein [Phenylobacterium sp.]MDP1874146.1 hypothetical protein [Phenylobacterium sp.]MDP3489594.1 hypothetical protein [Phenylobacterium sp.]